MQIAERKVFFVKIAVIFAAVILAIVGFQSFSAKYERVSASVFGPSASHTNAPGEANCTSCHGDFPVNSGTVSICVERKTLGVSLR